MKDSSSNVSLAFWTYVIPMMSARAMKMGFVLFCVFVVSAVVLFGSGFVPEEFVDAALEGMRHFLVMVGLPVAAVLLSEMPIRDGITHRTLLYPLLGPVPRMTLSIVRFLVTAVVLSAGTGGLLLLIRVMLGESLGFFGRELLAVTLGSMAYVAIFGFVHLLNRHGLIAGLAILFLFDIPLGKVPFSIRNCSPSYHVGVIAGQQESFLLPISLGQPETSVLFSSVFLLCAAFLLGSAVTIGFNRKNLGELC